MIIHKTIYKSFIKVLKIKMTGKKDDNWPNFNRAKTDFIDIVENNKE